MKVEIEELSPIKKLLKFAVPREDYRKALESAYQKLRNKVQIKGFRKGKAPRSILEKYYGARTEMDTVSDLIDRCYREAIREHKLPAVGMPKVEELKLEGDADITFNAEVEVQPQVTTQHYEKIPIKKIALQVEDAELESELKSLQKKQAQWTPLPETEAAASGHSVTLNFHGHIGGKHFAGGSGENATVILGSGRFLPDFEQGLLGAKKGEKRTFDVNFPADYGSAELQGKTAQFDADILEIKSEQLPELDDEFAKDLGNYADLAALKAELSTHILEHKEKQSRSEYFEQILNHLIEKNPIELPEAMIDRELDYMWQTVLQQLGQQKLKPEQIGLTQEAYRQDNREAAARRIKGFLFFDSISQQNNLKIEGQELDEELAKIAASYGQPLENVKKVYQERGLLAQLYSQLLEKKILDFILEKAELS